MNANFFEVPEALWREIAPLLPRERSKPRGGRPRVPDRVVLAGIVYRLRTGCQWKALPRQFGSGSTCHLRMQEWRRRGVFRRIHATLVQYYRKKRGLYLRWSALDSAMVKAPKGGATRGRIRRTAGSAA
jgi:transposase